MISTSLLEILDLWPLTIVYYRLYGDGEAPNSSC
jgi:hypothetical protein